MGLFNLVNSLNNRSTFLYIFIIVISLFIYSFYSIGLNTFLALVVGLLVIIYIQDRKETLKNNKEEEMETKLESIRPEPKNFREKDDLIDFFFSIQDLYDFNPQAYEEMLDNVEAFFKIYDYVFKDVKYCDYYYQIAYSKKNNAINALHSMVYTLPNSKQLIDKFDRAHKRLETILNDYINKLYDKCNGERIKKGLSNENMNIYLGPRPYNQYSEKDYTYQFY